MYENLGLKNEFLNNLRNYIILVFTAGDLNKIKDLFMKYDYIHVVNNNINQAESIASILGFIDENTCI